MKKLKIYRKHEGIRLPTRAHPTDAGLDLRAAETTHFAPGEVILVPCGIKIEIEPGYTGLIFPRSGLASKFGVTLANSVGVIDSDYRGEIMCAIKSESTYTINAGDRIAQLVIVPIALPEIEEIDELTGTNRGEGGFGHTGK